MEDDDPFSRYAPKYYILDGKEIVPASLWEWARWYGSADRHVAQVQIGQYWVSTVFLGLDHNHWGEGAPLLFETMIFDLDGKTDHQTRCSTWKEAEAMHAMACAHVRQGAISHV